MVSLQRLLLAETNKTAGKGSVFKEQRCLDLRGSHLIRAQEIVIVLHIVFSPICFLPLKIFFCCCCFKGKDFPGGLVAKTPCSQCKGPGFDPWFGTRSHLPQLRVYMGNWKILCTTSKTWCSQIYIYIGFNNERCCERSEIQTRRSPYSLAVTVYCL